MWSCSPALLNSNEAYLRMKTLLVTLQPFTVQFSKEQITFYTLLNHFAKGFQKTFLVEYLYVAASGIQTSVFAERLLQLHMILKKLLFLFKSTDLTGLNCFKAGYEAGHSRFVTLDALRNITLCKMHLYCRVALQHY